MLLQVTDTAIGLLNTEHVTAIGVLLAVCFLLILDRIRIERKFDKRYDILNDNFVKEQKENKELLVALVERSAIAMEQNASLISNINDFLHKR
jgi:hypothetical protein